jgi:hypothetical protein
MTDDTTDADVLTSSRALSGELSLGDETITIEMSEPSFDDLEQVEEGLSGEADDVELAREYIDEFLVQPDVEAQHIPVGKALRLFARMQELIAESSDVDAALEEMPLDDEGNG